MLADEKAIMKSYSDPYRWANELDVACKLADDITDALSEEDMTLPASSNLKRMFDALTSKLDNLTTAMQHSRELRVMRNDLLLCKHKVDLLKCKAVVCIELVVNLGERIERWVCFCDTFITDSEFGRRSTTRRTNRQKQKIRLTSGSKSYNQIRAEMVARLEREPSFQEWRSRYHMSGKEGESQWSNPEAGELTDHHLALSTEKCGGTPDREHPPFDKAIWRQERDVVANQKHTHGDLPPYYVEEHRQSYSAYGQPSYSQSQSSQPSPQMESQMTMIVEKVTKLQEDFTTYMSQGHASQCEEIQSDDEENDPKEEARMYARWKEMQKEKKKSK